MMDFLKVKGKRAEKVGADVTLPILNYYTETYIYVSY